MIEFSQQETFDFLGEDYAELFARSDATAFQHPIWLDRLHRVLLPARGAEAATLTGRLGGRLVMAMPLIRRRLGPLTLYDAADLGVCDYNAPVIDRALLAALDGDAKLRASLRSALPRWALSRIRKVRPEQIALVKSLGATHATFMELNAHEVALSAPFSEWRAKTLEPAFSHFLDKKRRLLAKKGEIALTALQDPAEIEAALRAMVEFRAKRWPNDALKDPANFAFYLDVARAGQASGFSWVYRMDAIGAPGAVMFGLQHRGRFLFVLIGFDFERLRNYSIGLLFIESVIEQCIARGVSLFDLTVGDEAYKEKFATSPVPMQACWAGASPLPALCDLAFARFLKLRARLQPPERPVTAS